MITVERLHQLLTYDPNTGEFTHKRTGKRAGCTETFGYRVIKLDGKSYKAHRLAWMMYFGHPPSVEIDHMDNDKTNNRITNLREASRSENMGNSKLQTKSRSGFKGVTKHTDGKWVANIRVNYKLIYLGIFDDKLAAAAAYQKAAEVHFGGYSK